MKKTSFNIIITSLLLIGLFTFPTQDIFAQDQTAAIDEPVSAAIPVTQSTANTSSLANLCKNVTNTITNGMITVGKDQILLSLTDPKASTAKKLYTCTTSIYENIVKTTAVDSFNYLQSQILWWILFFLSTIVNVGIWLLRLSSWIMGLMIGQGSFITNSFVKEAWPFIQGLANLGFIFALLYIAFATTLRLESVSTSVQRLLPKLLIGALLVNFSLIIGGLLIDVSRVLMAVEITVMGSSSNQNDKITPGNLGVKLLRSAGIYNDVFTEGPGLLFNRDTDANGKAIGVQVAKSATQWTSIFSAIQTLIFVWALAIGMMVIALGLFWRYIMLLLLLIVSPGIYLALALPQTKKWFDKWWSEFLKWVMYGPIMLFILILIIRVQAIDTVQTDPGDTLTPVYQSVVRLIVTVALMMVAAGIAKKSSGTFANSFMGMVGKTGDWAKKNPKKAFIAATGGLGLPIAAAVGGGQYATRGGVNMARDFGRDVSSKFLSKTRGGELFGKDTSLSNWAKFVAGPERDEKGKPKPGESSYGNKKAGEISFLKSQEAKQAGAMADSIQKLPDVTDAEKLAKQQRYKDEQESAANPLHSTKLLKKKVAVELSKDQLKDLAKYGDQKQINAVITHKDVVRKMDDETKDELMSRGGDIAKKLDSRMRDLANEK